MTDDELRKLAMAASDRDADWLPARFNLGMEFATILALLDRLAAAERDARAVEAAALERAARVCDEMQDSDWSPIQCADAIRAMIPKAQGARDE